MAFGVKWNETGEESGREFAERRAASPGLLAPAADPGPGRRCGGCTPGPETLSSHSAPDRTGRGRRGRDEAVSHFPLQSKTHRHAPGTPARHGTEPRAAPPRRARSPSPGLRRGSREAHGRASGWPREEPWARTLPSPSSPHLDPAVGPGKARRPGAAGYSPHDTGVFSSEAGHAEAAGSCKTQSQIKAEPGCIPGPGVTGDKVCREAAGV